MHVELVETTTPDQLELWGALGQAEQERIAPRLVICLHGVASNFYASPMMAEIAAGLNRQGLDVLRVNTRGHDACAHLRSAQGGRRLGAAFEVVDDCRLDISGWLQWASSRGYQDVVLLGHSLGGLKVIYSESRQASPQVSAVIALSPPRLSSQAFQASDVSELYQEDLQLAQQKVAAGQAEDLIKVQVPLPLLITARGYLDKYGPGERYNLLNFIDQVRVPLLVTYGGLELQQRSIAFAGMKDAITQQTAGTDQWPGTVRTIEGANHSYQGKVESLLEVISQWLAAS
jgi:pimeloyl-ACP methyl ester carboxylesterase